MMFRGDGLRATVLRTAGAALAAVLLSSCGGGEQVQKFLPTRIIAFGDEASVIENIAGDPDDPNGVNGRKYSVNYKADASTARDCKASAIWIKILASNYGLVFPNCNPDAVAAPASRILAIPDATAADPSAAAADVKKQIDDFLAAGGSFSEKDLVTVLAGQHDILNQYEAVKAGTTTQDQAIAVLEAAGAALAGQVNRIAGAGGKVLISTVPDLGLTPFARAEETTTVGREALLSLLTDRFNSKLRVNLLNDGRKIGLLLTHEMVQSISKVSSLNWTDAACAIAVPDCTTLTLATTPTTTMPTLPTPSTVGGWLWSDPTHLGVGGHSNLGSLAVVRATGNPF